jgi:hypothetical protein
VRALCSAGCIGNPFHHGRGRRQSGGHRDLSSAFAEWVSSLPAVLEAVGDFAAHTSIAEVVSLLDCKERCKHMRRLGAEGYQVDGDWCETPPRLGA